MWNCGGCAHPVVTGFTEQEVLTQKALANGVKPGVVLDSCLSAQQRIENALILHNYCEWIKSHRLQQVATDTQMMLIKRAIKRRLLDLISKRISCNDEVLAAMCNKRNWKAFAATIDCKRSWEEVSEIDASFMMRIRATQDAVGK